MTETIEQEAGRRVREQVGKPGSHSPGSLHALALEQLITEHRATKAELEAFRREVSDAVERHKAGMYLQDTALDRFIIPQPDPLDGVIYGAGFGRGNAELLREAADRQGYRLELVKKEPSQ